MNTLDTQYINLLKDILKNGTDKLDRTGTGTKSVTGRMIQHDMSEGFPAITTKKLFFKTMSIELEGFLKGITDKQWYKDKGCHIWDSWSNSSNRPKNISPKDWNDLGTFYSHQWRNFNGNYYNEKISYTDGFDQVEYILNELKTNPSSRRMVVSAWNPQQFKQMSLFPCHFSWQVIIRGEYLDLIWNQRSADVGAGIPFNIASYGLLLSLLAKQFGYKSGILTGFLGDTHIYNNHIEPLNEQLKRESYDLPQLEISNDFKDIREFNSNMVKLKNYKHHSPIKLEIAI